MKIINHRINKIDELNLVPDKNGVEIDIRDYCNQLVLAHDPFCGGDLFEKYIENYNKSTLIINIKSEGVEFDVLNILKQKKIDDFFLLDSSFSMINKFISIGEKRFAARFSEIESIQSVYKLAGKANWVWIDCFSSYPLTVEIFNELKNKGFRICICSPDLVNRPEDVESYVHFFIDKNIIPDAVCVKANYQMFWVK